MSVRPSLRRSSASKDILNRTSVKSAEVSSSTSISKKDVKDCKNIFKEAKKQLKQPALKRFSVSASKKVKKTRQRAAKFSLMAGNIFSKATKSLSNAIPKPIKKVATKTAIGVGAAVNLPFLVVTGSTALAGRKLFKVGTVLSKPVKKGFQNIKQIMNENFPATSKTLGSIASTTSRIASKAYELPSYALDKLDNLSSSIDKKLGQINDDSVSSNFKFAGLKLAQLGVETLKFTGDLITGTLYSMTVGNLVDTANSFADSGIIMEDYSTNSSVLKNNIDSQLQTDYSIDPKDSGETLGKIDEQLSSIKSEISNLKSNLKTLSLNDRIKVNKEISKKNKAFKKLETLKNRFSFSRLSSSQKFAATCDQLNETTAAVGNSLWNIGFVGSTVCPPLAGIGALGGCIFLSAKATNVLTNAVLRSSIDTERKAELKEKIITNLNSLINEDTTTVSDAIVQEFKDTGSISPSTFKMLFNKIGEESDNLNELIESLDQLKVTTDDQSKACKNAVKSSLQFANWALFIYGAGTAGGALMSGESIGGSFDAGAGHISGAGEATNNTLGAQFDMSGLESNFSQEAFAFNSDPALIGDILTEYPLFYLEGKYLADAVDSLIDKSTKQDTSEIDTLTHKLQLLKEGKPEELKTFLEIDLKKQGVQPKDITLVIDHFLENATTHYQKPSIDTPNA